MKQVSDITQALAASHAARESRRAAARRAVVLPCQAVRERDFRLVADRTLDISADGLLLPLRTPVLTGESLIVSFAIPGLWIDAEATAARIVHGRRPGDDGRAVGVVFDRISPSTRAALVGYLHARKAPLPRRGPLSRVRRGQDAPQLADFDVMSGTLVPGATTDTVDLCDVVDVTDEEPIDGLGVLRAVVGAWRNLLGEPAGSH